MNAKTAAVLGFLALATGVAVSFGSAGTSDAKEDDAHPLDALDYRLIGPINMSGRVADVEGVPGDPRTVWVGSASGGVWVTRNGGLTFTPVFDDQPVASVGDLAIAPTNADVVYVGTGESKVRNSVSIGNGVYRTNDGGATWTHLGLEETRHISRVVVHPRDPDTVWVAALGHAFGPNEERGVFKSTDGGENWRRVLYLDDRHGASDLALDPTNPNVLYAGLWHFERKPWTHTTGSEEGGVYRSVDGGETWKKLEKGLPKLVGRIGIDVAATAPRTVYVIAESREGTLYRSNDRGDTFEKVHEDARIVSRGLYYTRVRVDPTDENRLYAISSRLWESIDGGKTFGRISKTTHVDYHALWIDPTDPDRMWQGQDGGVAVSYDRGKTWEPVRNLPLGQFYQIFHDDREPFYAVGGGLQDNGSWWGPSRTREPAGILQDSWNMFSFGDAYWIVPHPDDPDLLISEWQGGGILKTDLRTRRQISITPQPRRNDGGPVAPLEYRFNWDAPIVESPHEPETVYFAGNVVFRSRDFGDTWEVISPDLTTDDPSKQGSAGGPAFVENTTAEYHCTIIAFAESPAEPGVLWAGTDDGNLQLSRDGGKTWSLLNPRLRAAKGPGGNAGVPEYSPVSHVEPSRTDAARAYVSFDRHMFDDYAPHVYETRDFGKTWRRISDGLPEVGWVQALREDPKNPDLLWAGTEFGLYATRDGGATWERMHLGDLPTVAVHDIRVHPRWNDLIVGTHGRAIWIFDDATPLQQWSAEIEASRAHVFPVRPALRFTSRMSRYGLGDKQFVAKNPPSGALVTFWVGDDGNEYDDEGRPVRTKDEPMRALDRDDKRLGGPKKVDRVRVEILDGDGEVIRTLTGRDKIPQKPGLHRVAWDLREQGPEPRRVGDKPGDFDIPARGATVLPGTYTVRLVVGDEVRETPVVVKLDPTLDVSSDELETLYAASAELAGMLDEATSWLRRLDRLKEQRDFVDAYVKRADIEIPDDIAEAWSEHRATANEVQGLLAIAEGEPFWAVGPTLIDRLRQLQGSIEGAIAAPTRPQAEYLEELRGEFGAAQDRVERFLTEDVPAINRVLEEQDLPTLHGAGTTGWGRSDSDPGWVETGAAATGR